MDQDRFCMECNAKLLGRKDQKFCDDHCRNAYNNNLLGPSDHFVRKVNGILRKNRKILKQLNQKGKATVERIQLLEEGFNFHYFTNIYETKKSGTYYFCYDQGYKKLNEEQYILVIKQDYVK